MGTALYPGRSYAGKVLVKDIGFPEMALEGEEEEGGRPERAFAYEKKDLCHIPERKADSNKGTFGKVLGVLFSIFIILALGFMGIWYSPIPSELHLQKYLQQEISISRRLPSVLFWQC